MNTRIKKSWMGLHVTPIGGLAGVNDKGSTFNEIADYIEEKL